MAILSYSMICSLDGYINDTDGNFEWAEPSAEVHAFINDREREVGTNLYGRHLYETMAVWETDPSLADQSPEMADYAQMWKRCEKIVYSTTLDGTWTSRTRLAKTFDPDEIRDLKATADAEIAIGGATLAASALRAGLVDEIRLYVVPVVIGSGTPVFPTDLRLDLELLDERRFDNGTLYLSYRPRP
ncbi:MAG: dihydrofolate reductase family protein [Acidimicrobiales bacterium]